MNLFLLIVGGVALINLVMVVALVQDVRVKARAMRSRVGLSLVHSSAHVAPTEAVRPSLVLVK